MNLKDRWKHLSARYAALAPRERALLPGAVCFAILMLGHLLVIEPATKERRLLQQRLAQEANDLTVAQAQITVLQAKLKNPAWIERQMGKLQRGIVEMGRELGDKAWCHGNGLTLADVALGCCLGWLSFRFPKIDWREQHPNLARHFDKLSELPAFADTAPK